MTYYIKKKKKKIKIGRELQKANQWCINLSFNIPEIPVQKTNIIWSAIYKIHEQDFEPIVNKSKGQSKGIET